MKLNTVICKDGGILQELYKSEESGQISMRTIHPGKSSGGSLHREKDEKWWVAAGVAAIDLEYPCGSTAQILIEGPASRIIEIPAGTGHRVSNHGSEPLVLIWRASKVYNPENPDRYAWGWQ